MTPPPKLELRLRSYLLVLVVALGVHARAVQGEPVHLDSSAVPWAETADLPGAHVWRFVLEGIARPADRAPEAAWQPVAELLLTAAGTAFEEWRVPAMHFAAILAHALASLALLRLASTLKVGPRAALLTALLFSVHPVVVESTAWISAAGAPLSGLFAILALERVVRGKSAHVAAFLYLLALLSDLQAVALLPAFWVLSPAGSERRRGLSALVGALGIAWGLRSLAYGSALAGFDRELDALSRLGPSLAASIDTLGGALAILAWPDDWNPFRTPPRDPGLAALAAPSAILGLAIAWLVLLVRSARRRGGDRSAGLHLGALLVSLLPLGVASRWMEFFPLSDHHLYLPAAFFALFAGGLLARLPRVPGSVLAILALGLFAYLDWTRIPHWKNDRVFLGAALERNPESPYAHWVYTQELLGEYKRVGRAEELYEAHTVIERAQDLLELSKEEGSTIFVTLEDFRQVNLALGFCLLALAEIDDYFDYETPREVFELITESDPVNVEAHLGSGMASFGLRELERAEESFRRVLAILPGSADAHHDLGRLEIARENWHAAQEHFEKALLVRPDALDDRLWLARSLLQQGATDRARREVEAAHELSPYHPEPMILLGILELERDEPSRALDWIDRSLDADPKNGFARLQRGHAFRRRAEERLGRDETESAALDLQNAVLEYRRASLAMPESFEAFYSLGDVLLVIGERDVALQQLTIAYGLQERADVRDGMRPALVEAFSEADDYAGFAAADYRLGHREGAEVWLEAALAIEPRHARSLHLRGLIERDRGDLERAIGSFRGAAEALPDSFQVQHDLAFALIEAERQDEAIEHLSRALDLVPDDGSPGAEDLREKIRDAIEQIRIG